MSLTPLKLSLRRETLHQLSSPSLDPVAGGSNRITEYITQCLTYGCGASGSGKGPTWICAQ